MFRYDNMAGFTRFLHKRFRQRIKLPKANVSPRGDLALPPALRTRLETERAEEFALYADRARCRRGCSGPLLRRERGKRARK